MAKKYLVELSLEERIELKELLRKGKGVARMRQHAQILLKADQSEGGPGWPDQRIAEAFDVSVRTVERVRQRLVERGLENALVSRLDPHGPKMRCKLDGKGEARLCQIACSTPPEGRDRWSVRLLAEALVRLEVVESIGRETVRATLKKMNSNPG